MRPTPLLFACCLAMLCGAAPRSHAGASLAPAPAAPLQAAAPRDDAPRRGALYRVRQRGQTAYLFGTIHVGQQDFFPLEAEVRAALAAASKLVMELDVRESGLFQSALEQHARYRPGDGIANHLDAASLARLERALRAAGIGLESVAHYKPWLLANLLVGRELERHGFQSGHGVEAYLLAAAPDKTVLGLESADYQLSLFDAMNDGQQERYLLENLAELESGDALRKSRGLIDAWSSADSAKIEAMLLELTSGDSVSSDFMLRTLLGRRNPQMAATIEHIIQDDKIAFVGVGLLHLVGAGGVPQLLMQRGYQVEQLY